MTKFKKYDTMSILLERRLNRQIENDMKLVMLVDSSNGTASEMADATDRPSIIIDTKHCDEANEYRYLLNSIDNFSQSNKEIMLANFSGKESITRNLGDECSEMIITLSDRKNSKYYTEYPIDMLRDLIKIFEGD